MYKMLIVEDERWEREGLADFLDWAAMGIGTVETACDGIEGLDKALELEPDIVITDIQMPGMNGIEMSKRIRERLPDVSIVVLTGYDDFEFARGAIRFQAVDYILKPVVEEEMRRMMLKAVRYCDEARLRREQVENQRREYEAGRRGSQRQAFADLLTWNTAGKESANTILAAMSELGGAIGEYYNVWVIRLSESSEVPDINKLEQQAVGALRRPVLAQVMGDGRGTEFALLLAITGGEINGQRELAELLLNRLSAMMPPAEGRLPQSFASSGWTLGMGAPSEQLELISESYKEAQRAVRYAVWSGIGGAVTAAEEEVAKLQFSEHAETFTRQFKERAKHIRTSVGVGQEGDTKAALEELFGLIAAYPGAGKAYIGTMIGNLLDELLTIAGDAAGSLESLEELLSCERQDEMRRCTAYMIGKIIAHLQEKRDNKDNYIVNRVIQLVEERYGSQKLSLAYLASEVYVSPNHLGMMFKKKTGKTPLEYIQEYRLARAEELLRTTKQRVSVIAEQVGIPNTSYFGTLFKQAYGITPGEYQETTQR